MDSMNLQVFLKSLSVNYPYGVFRVKIKEEIDTPTEGKYGKYKVIFICSSDLKLSVSENELFQAAVTKGLKFNLTEVLLVNSDDFVKNSEFNNSKTFIFLGKNILSDQIKSEEVISTLSSVLVIETFSLAEVLGSLEIKKLYWKDIQGAQGLRACGIGT